MEDTMYFKNKKRNKNKLYLYGFKYEGGMYIYSTAVLDNQFNLEVCISDNGDVQTKMMDVSMNEEYILHKIQGAHGSFVGRIKEEYDRVLSDIANQCFDTDIFKSNQAKELMEYVEQRYSDSFEYLWKNFPKNAVLRRKENKKWYCALATISKNKLGINSDEQVDVIAVRGNPNLIDNQTYFPGWHMNKNHWISIMLDQGVDFEEVKKRIDESYQKAK